MSMCCGSWYICSSSGTDECSRHGGFDSCCADPACPGTLSYAHLIDRCAARLHQEWRKAHKGEAIMKRNDKQVEVDVTGLTYSKLPSDLQASYVRLSWRGLRSVILASSVERAAELAHADWLQHSDDADPLQRLPYFWLDEGAKECERELVRTCAKILKLDLPA